MKKTLAICAALIAALPLAASAQTYYANTTSSASSGTVDQAALQAQIATLLQQVTALQQQMGVSGSGSASASAGTGAQGVSGLAQQAGVQVVDSSSCPQIGRSLKIGSSGDDVTRLQQFLARDSSVYPEGTVSGYYGSLTEAAVRRWQVKYNIVSSGSAETTGYGVVGPRTAAAISLQCSTYAGGGTSAPVGGYIQVSPISGNAPLTVNVQATVNTTNACGGATYTLNWGDNTPNQSVIVPSGTCTQASQTYTHVYQYGGTYLVVLSAGGHRTTATVTVYGPSAPTSYVPQGNPGVTGTAMPPETFSATPLSGTAPLIVTFSGLVNSADAGWCGSGCSDILSFGDGTTGSVPLPTAQGTWQTYSLTHSYAQAGIYTPVLYQGQANSGRTVGTVTINITGGSGNYGPLTVTPGTGGNPKSITASFSMPSACTGYDLSWGDGSSDITQTDGGSSCSQTTSAQSFTHQYASSGSYSITLKRGPALATVDTATLSITN